MPKAAKPGVKAGAAKPGAKAGAAKIKKKAAAEIIEEEEPKATHPTVLVVTVIALLAALYFCFQQYTVDTTFGRVSEPTFGWPSDGSESAEAADEEEATEEASADEGGEEEEAADEEE